MGGGAGRIEAVAVLGPVYGRDCFVERCSWSHLICRINVQTDGWMINFATEKARFKNANNILTCVGRSVFVLCYLVTPIF